MNSNLHLIVRNRDGIIFEEDIKSLSSKNKIGKFDVLDNHENFISIISDILVVETASGAKKEIPITNSILKVKENKVEVYAGVKK